MPIDTRPDHITLLEDEATGFNTTPPQYDHPFTDEDEPTTARRKPRCNYYRLQMQTVIAERNTARWRGEQMLQMADENRQLKTRLAAQQRDLDSLRAELHKAQQAKPPGPAALSHKIGQLERDLEQRKNQLTLIRRALARHGYTGVDTVSLVERALKEPKTIA